MKERYMIMYKPVSYQIGLGLKTSGRMFAVIEANSKKEAEEELKAQVRKWMFGAIILETKRA